MLLWVKRYQFLCQKVLIWKPDVTVLRLTSPYWDYTKALSQEAINHVSRIQVLFQNVHRFTLNLAWFEDNDGRKLPFKYY